MTASPNTLSPLAAAAGNDAGSWWGSCCTDPAELCAPTAPMPWFRFAVGLFIAAQTMLFALAINLTPPQQDSTRLLLQGAMLAATVLVMVLLGPPLLAEALVQIRRRRITMEALFLLGVIGAFALSCQSMLIGTGPVYFEVVSVLLIVYCVGRAISRQSRRKALSTLGELTDALAWARREQPGSDKHQTIAVDQISVGDLVRVLPGELIPVDGTIVTGQAFVRETAFSGQWIAARRAPGDRVMAGTFAQDATLLIRAAGSCRRIDRLTALISETWQRPSALQREADRFVRWLLPVVLATAIGTFVYWSSVSSVHAGLFNALAVLLVACPCAAGLATPLVQWTVMGSLARLGLALRSGDAVQQLATADSVIFDKTGTLGDERLTLESLHTVDDDDARIETMAIIAAVERHSTHPVAALLRDLPLPADAPAVTVRDLQTLPGRGVESRVQIKRAGQGDVIRNVRILRDDAPDGAGLTVGVEIDGRWAATAAIGETLRDTSGPCIDQLQQLGLAVRIMTGDGPAGAAAVSQLAQTTAAMSPQDKVDAVNELRRGDPSFRQPLFVGDGLNDAAAMAGAYSSIALARGSAVAMETAAATLHGGDMTLIPRAVDLARRALHVVRTNLWWAIAYNLVGILAAATGYLHPVFAALLMAGSSALVSWRSFHVTQRVCQLPTSPQPKPLQAQPQHKRLRLFAALHLSGAVAQVGIVALIAGLSLLSTAITVAAAAAITVALLGYWRRTPAWADMTVAMITLGGLGMTLGWWADLGFAPAAGHHMAHHAQHNHLQLLSWMNAGMLALGVPAMFLLRHTAVPFDLRRFCCGGMLVIGVPAMVAGMMAGYILSRALAAGLAPSIAVILDYLLMMAGMCAGMLIPHALEYAFPRPLRTAGSYSG